MGAVCGCEEKDFGLFICPICHKKSGYDKWERKGDKWIFHMDNVWYASGDGRSYDFPQECWKKTGGGSAEQWNKIKWICSICHYPSDTFYDYIPDYKGTEEYRISREKRKNDFLTKELISSKMDNILLNKEADLYYALLKRKKGNVNLNY